MAKNKDKSLPVATRTLAVPTVEESAIVFARIRPLAEALPARDIVEFSSDASLIYHNLRAGAEAVLKEEARIRAELMTVRIDDLREAMLVAQALIFAAAQVPLTMRGTGTTAELVARAYELRSTLIENAQPLVRAGLLPAAPFREILKGRGKLDAANDCVDLTQLFRDHWPALEGKTVVTPEMLTDAAQVGSTLQTIILPGRAVRRRQVSPQTAAAAIIRDRIWTLLRQRYDLIWRVGAWLWGPEVEERVPALQSAVARRRADSDTEPPEAGGSETPKGPTGKSAKEPVASSEAGLQLAGTDTAGAEKAGAAGASAAGGSIDRGGAEKATAAREGTAKGSTAKEGAAKKGAAGKGAAKKGAAKKGAAKKGTRRK
jgi:hypothetical protein